MYTLLFFFAILAAVFLCFERIQSKIWQGVWLLLLVALIFKDVSYAGTFGALLTIALIVKKRLPKARDF